MKSFSNTYIFVFSTVMVIIVAAILSFAAMQLKPLQDKNIEVNKKQQILSSLNIISTPKDAEEKYDKYITDSYVVDSKGNVTRDKNAFDIDLKKELDKPESERNLPVYIGTVKNQTKYILPVEGKGLWGPVWGYIALNEDVNTIYGTTFSHKAETPGLGAEIDKIWFQEKFIGKAIFNDKGEFISVRVVKGGTADSSSKHEVDGISGGTITSKGVDAMLLNCLESYVPHLKNIKNR